jgi:hypothetical protein
MDPKRTLRIALLLATLLAAGCGDDPVSNTPGPGPGGSTDLGPFSLNDIFLRPYSIQVPSHAQGIPTPSLVEHYLSGFYSGGTDLATFDWTVPATHGTVEPKTTNLDRHAATVVLRLRSDVQPPLGLFYITTHARAGTDSSTITRRFAVIENTWVKQQRLGFIGDEPEDLTSWPAILTHASGVATDDSLFYVVTGGPTTTRIRRMAFTENLGSAEQVPGDCLLPPEFPEVNNYDVAPKTMPDVAPVGLGRREMIFSSRMDPDFQERCPTPTTCTNKPGLRLWVATLPAGEARFRPRVLTADSTYLRFGRPVWYGFDFEQPRWCPTASGPRARIAFLSNLAGNSVRELWVADLVDANGDNRSDSLDARRDLTPGRAVSSYDWHPDGTRLCVAGSGGLAWVDAGSGAIAPIPIPDNTLAKLAFPAVFWRPGEHTLIVFQAETENLRNLYLLDVEANTLTRLLPYAVPVTHNLFPRWHPTRKQLIYVSDYTVMAWANTTPTPTGPDSRSPDRLNPNNSELYGMPRTFYPSLWMLKLE